MFTENYLNIQLFLEYCLDFRTLKVDIELKYNLFINFIEARLHIIILYITRTKRRALFKSEILLKNFVFQCHACIYNPVNVVIYFAFKLMHLKLYLHLNTRQSPQVAKLCKLMIVTYYRVIPY